MATWLVLSDLGVQHFALFLVSATLFVLTPGIDTVFVLNRTLGLGRRAGIMAACGVATGVLVHTVFAALGLAALLATSAYAFMLVKYLGAAYLIYLGVVALKNAYQGGVPVLPVDVPRMSSGRAYVSGLLTNVLNPKVALFFLAFFPQFITVAHRGDVTPYLVLGLVYALISVVWLVALAVVGALFSRFLQSQQAKRKMDGICGLVFVALGAKVALSS